ncbi:folylpolyglutamate synthase [Heliomicrobium modesticaldum Ice1]|uniref:tetrahydrofolate synthase n=1 Tax=Heliobacterium modesticaldum (strain ATCC 51547 / Ice1) TaxID=498761 RepID=B0TC04_HELMI|nr:folylpolyglutamate synthase/dihydrofolate synthase family protein [Heliomicrobium modesticaldum]ABZ85277.1 folylpolyglutamate synthase [Heliomicrobium modesticaldum Ice1]
MNRKAKDVSYDDALAYLKDLTKFGFNFGLGRITELLRRLGEPHRKKRPAFIHIGGTNGKGSTSVMTAAVLQAAGHRVGLFTSPHLHCYTERTRINGKPIPKETMAALIAELRPHLEAMVAGGFEHPTEFEVWTALSLLYFAREAVDVVVLEVGLGGSIDSTNVVTPIVACITNVSFDHMDYLGTTLPEIAAVKAGIVKAGVPLVTASDDAAVLAVLREKAQRLGAPIIQVLRQGPRLPSATPVRWYPVTARRAGILVEGRFGIYGPLTPPLSGRHQQANLATAVAVLEAAKEKGFDWRADHLEAGLGQVSWPGRLERIGPFLLDGAHNVAGALSLAAALREEGAGKYVFVLGMLADKERERVVDILAPLAKAIIVTRPNSPRAGEWQALASLAARRCDSVTVVSDIGEALEMARLSAQDPEKADGEGHAPIVVTGSLYMVAEARGIILSCENDRILDEK